MSGEGSCRPLPDPWGATSWLGDGLVSDEFLAALCERLNGADTAVERIDIDGDRGARRLVERVNVTDATLAASLETALRPLLPSTITVDARSGRCVSVGTSEVPLPSGFDASVYDQHMGPFAGGDWELAGIDRHVNMYRYPVGGVFSQHRDAPRFYSADERTFFTVLVYLNAAYEGGRTTVLDDDGIQAFDVAPRPGRAFLMLQRTLHQGSEVTSGSKEILRCDVLYRRLGASDAPVQAHLDNAARAAQWHTLGLALEESGQLTEAVKCYQRARKIDPTIEL